MPGAGFRYPGSGRIRGGEAVTGRDRPEATWDWGTGISAIRPGFRFLQFAIQVRERGSPILGTGPGPKPGSGFEPIL